LPSLSANELGFGVPTAYQVRFGPAMATSKKKFKILKKKNPGNLVNWYPVSLTLQLYSN